MMGPMPEPGVSQIDPSRDARWDEYVLRHPDATAYHLGAWAEILNRSYRFEPRYLALVDGSSELRGVLPLTMKRGPLSGRRMRSLPVVPTGGPLADDAVGAEMLCAAACEMAEQSGSALIIEGRQGGLEAREPRLRATRRPPSWVTALPEPGAGDAWLAARSKNLSRSIKKARKSPLTARESTAEADLRALYRLYLITMRRHRELPRLFRQLELARSQLGTSVARVFVVEEGQRVIAGGLFHTFGDSVELLYNGSDPDALQHRPNHLLYDYVMRWAGDRGLKKLDFGFAWEHTSLGKFKALWGAEQIPEHGYVYVPDGDRRLIPAASASEGEEGRRDNLLSGVWRRAPWAAKAWERAPLPATRLASGVAYRYL